MSERGFVIVDCPHCFESSGYVWEHGNDWNSGPWSHQTNIPCRECNGTGLVPCEVSTAPDDREDDFEDDGYLASLDAELNRRLEQRGKAA